MKNLLTLCFLVMTFGAINAQVVASCSGTITGCDNNPVPNTLVAIQYHGGYEGLNLVYTDSSGFYSDSIVLSPNQSPNGPIYIEYYDCLDNLIGINSFYDPIDYHPIVDLEDYVASATTAPPVPDSCNVFIFPFSANELVAFASGVAPITYQWNTGETTPEITPLTVGQYCVTIEDATGCIADICHDFPDSTWVDNPCHAGVYCDPAGNLVASAFGTAPFTYLWNTGETTEVIMPTDTGTYCVTITDAVGCEAAGCSHYVGTGVNDPCQVYVIADAATNYFYAESFDGVPPFTYEWSTGETTQGIFFPTDGLYCVTLTDATGCESSQCIPYVIQTFDSCTAFVDATQGGLMLAVPFGTAPYTYQWDNGDTTQTTIGLDGVQYCVTITDATGCLATACGTAIIDPFGDCLINFDQFGNEITAIVPNPDNVSYFWGTGETTATIQPPSDGLYCVTVTAFDGSCSETACLQFVDPNWVDSCNVQIAELPIDSITSRYYALASGNGPYTYLWDDGTILPKVEGGPNETHCVTITDASGCMASACSDDLNSPSERAIRGYIYTIDSTNFPVFVNGTVDLIDALSGNTVETTNIQQLNGYPFYNFGDVADGIYLIRASVVNPNGSVFIPTYHFSTTLSSEAKEIEVPYQVDPSFRIGFDILVFDTQRRPGDGGINGNVTKEPQFAGTVDPQRSIVENVSIILFDESQMPIQYYSTNATGDFEFPSLEFGTYHVYIDLPGHDNAFFTVVLDKDNPTVDDLNFNIDKGRIFTNNSTSSTKDFEAISEFRIFPNPSPGNVQIFINSSLSGNADLSVSDVSGRLIQHQPINLSNGTQTIRLDLTDADGGVYFVRLIDGNRSISKRLIIK